MIETFKVELAHSITLSYRATGPLDKPLLVFLHGFPEGAFIWDEVISLLGTRYRCVAPNLRGYADSSSPAEVEAYHARELAADIEALVHHLDAPVAALVAHDWGGAVAWALGARAPHWLQRLVIINSPHPATFLRELQRNAAQQAASAYMGFLSRPDAEPLLIANDYERMWQFFTGMGAVEGSQPGAGWLTDAIKEEYRKVWGQGLNGALNYYRVSPLKPAAGGADRLAAVQLPASLTHVRVPTLVLWADADIALLPVLLDGLDEYVPQLSVVRIAEATHWVVHEQPALIAGEIAGFVEQGQAEAV